MDSLAALLRIRQSQGLSQEQLASRLGVSFATVNRWEGGKSSPQRAQREAIAKLAEELDTNADSSESPTAAASSFASKPRRGLQRSAVLGNKSMEQMLWDAACAIRGEKDAPKFKDYLLPLVFLKRLSDVFDDEVARLTQTYGDAETATTLIEADHS